MSFTKISNYLFLAFLFLLPWQTRLIYSPAYVNGGFWELGTRSLYGIEILGWAVVFIFFIHQWQKKELFFFTLFKTKEWLLTGLFFGVLVVNSLLSSNFAISLQFLSRLLLAILLFLTAIHISFSWQKGLLAWWCGGIIQSALAIVQFFSQHTFAYKWLGLAAHYPSDFGASVIEFESGRWLRGYGSFGSPNALGIYLALALIGGIILLQRAVPRYRAFLLAGELIIFSGLIVSFSRGAWLAAAVGLGMGVWYAGWKKYWHYFACFVCVACWFFAVFHPLFASRFAVTNRLEVRSITERVSQLQEAKQMLKNNVWFGVGAGAYTSALYQRDSSRQAFEYQPVHNMYLLALVEEGILGIAALLIASYFFLKHTKIRVDTRISLLCTLVVSGLFDHWLWSMPTGVFLGAIIFGFLIKKEKIER